MKEDQGTYRPLSYFQLMEVTLRELLVEKGVLTREQVDSEVAAMRKRTPERGAKVIARAWADPAFKEKLLENGSKACESIGIQVPGLHLVAVENTPQVHNVIVCTLCSCYPRMLLGIPPDWYKSLNYRSRIACTSESTCCCVSTPFSTSSSRNVTSISWKYESGR